MLEPASCKQWIMRGGQPQMRKHRQAPISPKIPKSQQLRPRTPHRCQDFRNFGEIGAWRGFGNGDVLAISEAKTLTGSNFPRFLKPEMQK